MRTRDIIAEPCALVSLDARTKAEAIPELVGVLADTGRLKDRQRCLEDVLTREKQKTTGIGGGIAIPHALTQGIRQPVIAIGRSDSGIDFDSADHQPVRLVFLLLGPLACARQHLQLLARLAQVLKSEGAMEFLLNAANPQAVLAFFDRCGQEMGDIPASEDMPKVCVAGAGAGGLAMASHLKLLGCDVRLYNRSKPRIHPVLATGGIQVSGEVNGFARIGLVTTDAAEALKGADLIMVVVPATGHRDMAERLGPCLSDGQIVILNPGRTGGALEFATVLRERGFASRPILAEAETLLYACRDVNPADVRIFSIKNAVPVAALPAYLTPDVLAVTRKCLPQFVAGDNVLKTSLDNIGSIFHPALTMLNAGWIEERHGDFEYYHEGASPSVTKVLEALDKERVAVAAALGIGVLSAREWLYMAYGAAGSNLHEAMQANSGYGGIKAPNDLNHRYITEDVPMSLVPLASLGEQLGVPVTAMKAIIHLASLAHGRNYWVEGRTVEKLGLAGLSVREIRRVVDEGFS